MCRRGAVRRGSTLPTRRSSRKRQMLARRRSVEPAQVLDDAACESQIASRPITSTGTRSWPVSASTSSRSALRQRHAALLAPRSRARAARARRARTGTAVRGRPAAVQDGGHPRTAPPRRRGAHREPGEPPGERLARCRRAAIRSPRRSGTTARSPRRCPRAAASSTPARAARVRRAVRPPVRRGAHLGGGHGPSARAPARRPRRARARRDAAAARAGRLDAREPLRARRTGAARCSCGAEDVALARRAALARTAAARRRRPRRRRC